MIIPTINVSELGKTQYSLGFRCASNHEKLADKYDDLLTYSPTTVTDRNEIAAADADESELFVPWKRPSGVKVLKPLAKVSGNLSHIENDPWQLAMYVALGDSQGVYIPRGATLYSFTCGSSLILPQWAVTAAHCITTKQAEQLKFGRSVYIQHRILVYGKTVLSSKLDAKMIRQWHYSNGTLHALAKYPKVVGIAVHPNYIDNLNKEKLGFWIINDIAVLKLDKAIPFTDYSRPVCLHSMPFNQSMSLEHLECHASGYGAVSLEHAASHVLMSSVQKLVDNGKVLYWLRQMVQDGEKYGNFTMPHGEMKSEHWVDMYKYIQFTIGATGNTCQGDSGGPLVCRTSKYSNWQLYGITSWGFGCMRGTPNAFTSVHAHADWIWAVVQLFDHLATGSARNAEYSKVIGHKEDAYWVRVPALSGDAT